VEQRWEPSPDGQTFIARRILAFSPDLRRRRFHVPLRKCDFYDDRALWKYYDFWWRGERHQGACHTKNTRVAEQIEAAKKTALALVNVGIVKQKMAPTFEDFTERFLDHIKGQRPDKTNTQSSTKTCIRHCYASNPSLRRDWTGSTKTF